ncbi:unnamed protein product [Ixodes persulcatus]
MHLQEAGTAEDHRRRRGFEIWELHRCNHDADSTDGGSANAAGGGAGRVPLPAGALPRREGEHGPSQAGGGGGAAGAGGRPGPRPGPGRPGRAAPFRDVPRGPGCPGGCLARGRPAGARRQAPLPQGRAARPPDAERQQPQGEVQVSAAAERPPADGRAAGGSLGAALHPERFQQQPGPPGQDRGLLRNAAPPQPWPEAGAVSVRARHVCTGR